MKRRIIRWDKERWDLKRLRIINIINIKFQKCLRTPISQGSCLSCTRSVPSLFKSGISKVSTTLCSSQRTHQAPHWSGHPVFSPGNHGDQCHYSLRHLSTKRERNSRHQTAFPRHDHQERITRVIQLKKYFTFEVQVLDDKNVRRRFRASNYQSTTRVKPFICTMPMRLDEGWNQIQFNLSDFTRRAYGSNYI